MSRAQAGQRSAVVFGARNLGRAVIEAALLIVDASIQPLQLTPLAEAWTP
jgi:hypothetical protein